MTAVLDLLNDSRSRRIPPHAGPLQRSEPLRRPPLHLGRVIAARGRKKISKVKSLLSRLLPYVQDRRCAWDCRVREVRTLSEQLRQHRQARRAISAKSTVVGAGLRARPHAFSCSMRARMRYSTASAPSLSLVACRGARGGLPVPPKVVLDRLMWEKSAIYTSTLSGFKAVEELRLCKTDATASFDDAALDHSAALEASHRHPKAL